MKGSSPAGQTQTTQVNPTQQMQQPFLQGGWNSALNLFNNNPMSYYPGQTLADFRAPNPMMTSGYQNIYNAGQNLQQGFLPGFNQNYQSMAGYAPAIVNYANQAAQNSNPALNSLMATAQGQGPGMEELAKAASGYYLNSNPYLDKAIQAAQDPVTRNYQTSTAPTIDAALSNSGRYGSGAQAGLYDTSQQNLTKSLGDISTNMSNLNYGRERQLQDAAAGMYGQVGNQAGSAAGQLYNQGLTLGMQGNTAASNAAAQYAGLWPLLAQAQMAGAQGELQAGQGLTGIDKMYRDFEQQQIADQQARFQGNQQAPYQTLDKYMGYLGNPQTGSGQTEQPYFQNQLSSLLGAGLGATGIYKNLGGSLGKGAAAAAPWAGFAAPAGAATGLGALAAPVAADAAWATPSLLSMLGIFSDRRLKEDDQVVGQIGDLPIHTFKYKGDDKQRIGFMADEVEKVDPGAVLDDPSGYKRVRYGQAFDSALNSFMLKKAA